MQITNIPRLDYRLVEEGFVTGCPIGQDQQLTRCSSNNGACLKKYALIGCDKTPIIIGPIRTFKSGRCASTEYNLHSVKNVNCDFNRPSQLFNNCLLGNSLIILFNA